MNFFNTHMLIPLLCLSCIGINAAEDERCSCQKPPRTPDTVIVNEQLATLSPELCPCGVKPRAEEEQELCPCSVKPRFEEGPELCPCSVKPRAEEEQELCPCSVKPRFEESPELCPCSVKPRAEEEQELYPCSVKPRLEESPELCSCSNQKPKKLDTIKNVYAYLHNQPNASLHQNKPKLTHKDIIERACNCSPKPHKLPATNRTTNNQKPTIHSEDGAALFVESTQALMNCVEGGIIVNNTGNLKEGLPYILDGIQTLISIASKSSNPQKTYQDIVRFIAECDRAELDMIFNAIQKR